MSRFRIVEKKLDEVPVIQLIDDEFGSFIEIAQLGATILNFTLKSSNGLSSIIDGYNDYRELLLGDGARSWIMAPFSNRLKNNRYTFNGKEYEFPGEPKSWIHGFVHNKLFEIESLVIEDDFLELGLLLQNIGQFHPESYPFNVDFSVRYRYVGANLKIQMKGINKGDSPAPLAMGWHPYFKIIDKAVDTYALSIPAEKVVLTDAELFPYPKRMAFTPLSNLPGSDFRPSVIYKKRVISRRQLNVCYSDLVTGPDGIVSRIENSETNSSITMKQSSGVVYCFTGDSLTIRPRHSIALEPVEFITDSFNREDLLEKITLQPGQERTFDLEISYKS